MKYGRKAKRVKKTLYEVAEEKKQQTELKVKGKFKDADY